MNKKTKMDGLAHITQEIESARKRLLDLSGRNRMINYRVSKVKSVEFYDTDIQGLFNILVNKERKLIFEGTTSKVIEEEKGKEPVIWRQDAASKKDLKQLKVLLIQELTQQKLYEVSRTASSFFEEQGYPILYIALGMVHWKSQAVQPEHQRAPLLLIPVELSRSSVGSPYRVYWTGDEIASNICLIEKAKELNIKIPEFTYDEDDPESITKYLNKLKPILAKHKWDIENYACLDFFSFTKLLLWKDLDAEIWQAKSNPEQKKLFQKLLLPISKTKSSVSEISDYADELSPTSVFHILNADPSQIAVIEAVKKGMNLVVEGPPGTGKSQTIANIIVELVAMGKKVLFVSEKMAALEVVKTRLDNSGVGSFCLELHSRKTNKKQFLKSVSEAWNRLSEDTEVSMKPYRNLEKARTALNDYALLLRTKPGARDLNLYQVFTLKEIIMRYFDSSRSEYIQCQIPEAKTIDSIAWEQITEELTGLSEHAEYVSLGADNPWLETSPRFVTDEEIEQVIAECGSLYDAWVMLNQSLLLTSKLYMIPFSGRVEDFGSHRDMLLMTSRLSAFGKAVINNPLWSTIEPHKIVSNVKNYARHCKSNEHEHINKDDYVETNNKVFWGYLIAARQVRHVLEHLRTNYCIKNEQRIAQLSKMSDVASFLSESQRYNCYFIIEALSQTPNIFETIIILLQDVKEKYGIALSGLTEDALVDVNEPLFEGFLNVKSKKIRVFSKTYRLVHKQLPHWLIDQTQDSDEIINVVIEKALSYYEAKRSLLKYSELAMNLFGETWKQENTDIESINSVQLWFNQLRTYINEKLLGEDIVTRLKTGLDYNDLNQEILEFKLHLVEINKALQRIITEQLDLDITEYQLKDMTKYIIRRLSLYRIVLQDDMARGLFGHIWQAQRSNVGALSELLTDIKVFKDQLTKGMLTHETVESLDSLCKDKGIRAGDIKNIQESDTILRSTKQLFEKMNLKKSTSDSLLRGDITQVIQILGEWKESTHELEFWSEYCIARSKCTNPISQIFIEAFETGNLQDYKDIIPCFEGSYADQLLQDSISNNPLLAGFKSSIHANRVVKFIELDKEVLELNRLRIKEISQNNRPAFLNNASHGSEVGYLLGEMNKKRSNKPIRQVIKRCGKLIQGLKPCFMMSPLSIAQYLDPESIVFDTIIFDEASQVKPEDALGSLLRGNQLVVMGDSKQLPPTSFFDHMTDEDEEMIDQEDEFNEVSITEVESILQQCLTKFPRKRLNWHYRSRHESLIVGSNALFYDNTLQVFPSPYARNNEIGLQFVCKADTVYERGRGAVNKLEAKFVVDLALEHFTTNPNLSLGIGTFSARQQNAIVDEMERRISTRPELQVLVDSERHEHFFIKNLETIQGDERDVIIISTGYGFDDQGKISMLFGPLNNEGGHRRLNVLITRARYKCVIVANFRSADLKVKSSSALGLRALKSYLYYAETGQMESSHRTVQKSPDFVESVYDFLRENGFEVQKQVGCASYRIDLAVCNHNQPGTYAIGIICDGKPYYNSPTARERDRLRKEILEGLGWKIYNIWSVDWYKRRSKNREDLVNAINEEINKPQGLKINEIKRQATPSDAKAGYSDEAASIPIVFPKSEIKIRRFRYNENASRVGLYLSLSEDKIFGEYQKTVSDGLAEIIDTESPIHFEDVLTIISSDGMHKTGSRVREMLSIILENLWFNLRIQREDSFYLKNAQKSFEPRLRKQPVKLDHIYYKEIIALIELVLKHQFSTEQHELCVQVARIFGVKRLTSDSELIIQRAIDEMVKQKQVTKDQDGIITLVQRAL